jgi:hypothetical protein
MAYAGGHYAAVVPGSSAESLSSNGAPFMAIPASATEPANNGYAANGMRTNAEDAADAQLAVEEISTLTARAVMRPQVPFIPAAFSLHNALLALDRYECSALPVVDGSGSYRGMVSRADLIAALGQQVRPPVVGGMATPLGVWLTTGSLSGGAPALRAFPFGCDASLLLFHGALSSAIRLAGLQSRLGDDVPLRASGLPCRLGENWSIWCLRQ